MNTVEVDAVDEQFTALVYSDTEWLRAEFDAIVAAEDWGSPPSPVTPSRGRAEGHSRAGRPENPTVTTALGRARQGRRRRTARTRSPPVARPAHGPDADVSPERFHRSSRRPGGDPR